MPFEIRQCDGYMLVRLYGVLSSEDLRQMAAEWARVAPEAPITNRVIDFSEVEQFEFGFSQMLEFAQRVSVRAAVVRGKSALIARRPVQVGLARMSQLINPHEHVESCMVSDLDAALRWFAR